ncbi:MAG: alanine:cation symporter family protein [Muribaculaceae bacterium]|nr:alanine:cation symporter family protein [Muribaculaceae bacterium]
MNQIEPYIVEAGNWIANYLLIPLLLIIALWMTYKTRGVQFRMFREMCRLLVAKRPKPSSMHEGSHYGRNALSSFQAFMVSVASHVGTGNLAGVATAITLGGPGAIFWMWVIALLAAAASFVECTLAQIFKVPDGKGGFRGGPAYYISRGIGSRAWAILFAILISLTFGFAYNSVQSNTISQAFEASWGVPAIITTIALTVLTLVIIWGGIRSIARFSEWVVPIMAVAYVIVSLIIIVMNIDRLPDCFVLIVQSAFGIDQVIGGSIGMALAIGIRRGLFSNEAGEGSAPNAAATANVSHPVKQGLVQALGVYTDTILICTCTAFIILLSGVSTSDAEGITLTQRAIDAGFNTGGIGATFISIAVFFFAFTSIVANYYYGETNIRFISPKRYWVVVYRLAVGGMVFLGGMSTLGIVWSLADITMSLMALCNIFALVVLGKYAFRALRNYTKLRSEGRNPVYYRETNPEIAHITKCWPSISGSSQSTDKKE